MPPRGRVDDRLQVLLERARRQAAQAVVGADARRPARARRPRATSPARRRAARRGVARHAGVDDLVVQPGVVHAAFEQGRIRLGRAHSPGLRSGCRRGTRRAGATRAAPPAEPVRRSDRRRGSAAGAASSRNDSAAPQACHERSDESQAAGRAPPLADAPLSLHPASLHVSSLTGELTILYALRSTRVREGDPRVRRTEGTRVRVWSSSVRAVRVRVRSAGAIAGLAGRARSGRRAR